MTTIVLPPNSIRPLGVIFWEYGVRSVRNVCLDPILIANETHLHRVLTEYIGYYNAARFIKVWLSKHPFPFHADQSTVKFTATTSWVASFMITVVRPPSPPCRTADGIFVYYEVQELGLMSKLAGALIAFLQSQGCDETER